MAFKTAKLSIKDLIEDRLFALKVKSSNIEVTTNEIMGKIKAELVNSIDEFFPKGKSKERGAALMLQKILV